MITSPILLIRFTQVQPPEEIRTRLKFSYNYFSTSYPSTIPTSFPLQYLSSTIYLNPLDLDDHKRTANQQIYYSKVK